MAILEEFFGSHLLTIRTFGTCYCAGGSYNGYTGTIEAHYTWKEFKTFIRNGREQYRKGTGRDTLLHVRIAGRDADYYISLREEGK